MVLLRFFLIYCRSYWSFPACPDTLVPDGSACQWTTVINGEVMDRSARAAETSQGTFTVSLLLARQSEGLRVAILCQAKGP